MNLRQLKKQDKRAAAALIARGEFSPKNFGLDDDGRYHVFWRCSYEYDEWDNCPAWEKWAALRDWEHPNACAWFGFNEATGEEIPEAERPRRMNHGEAREFYKIRPPEGFRWRGRRMVRVDKHGAMVRHQGRRHPC